MTKDEIEMFKWYSEGEEMAKKLVKQKAKGLEWMTSEDISRFAFISTSEDAPRQGDKVTFAKVEAIGRGDISKLANFLLKSLANKEIKIVIWFYEEFFMRLSKDQKSQFVHHELLHIRPFDEDRTDYMSAPHDIEEFDIILEAYPESRPWVIRRMIVEAVEKEKAGSAEQK